MATIKIPATEIEFDPDGKTMWVHSPLGATILRIKTMGKIVVDRCDMNPVSHADIVVKDDIKICVTSTDLAAVGDDW